MGRECHALGSMVVFWTVHRQERWSNAAGAQLCPWSPCQGQGESLSQAWVRFRLPRSWRHRCACRSFAQEHVSITLGKLKSLSVLPRGPGPPPRRLRTSQRSLVFQSLDLPLVFDLPAFQHLSSVSVCLLYFCSAQVYTDPAHIRGGGLHLV